MATKPKRLRSKARGNNKLSGNIFRLVSEMEDPLREATQLVHLLSLVDPKEGDDLESIAFVATKAQGYLMCLNNTLRNLFSVTRRRF